MELALYRTAQQQEGCSGAVVQNIPAEETNTTAAMTTMTTMTSCPQQQNIILDDGYGSSNSSPHSSGIVRLACNISVSCLS
jgi:hypothetical protein